MKQRSEYSYWREAWQRLQHLDTQWDEPQQRQRLLRETAQWLAACEAVPHLAQLARLLPDTLTRAQFWSVLVPVERAVARQRVTDVEILEGDGRMPDTAAVLMPVTLVVDSLRSAFNLGGVLRTAECFGVQELILCGYTPTPAHKQVARAALGTEKLVRWRQVGALEQALDQLQQQGVACVALETVADAPQLETFRWPLPCAIVLGNERFGINAAAVARCDASVRIAMYGRKNSLNVVSALAVTLHSLRVQLN